MKLQILLLSLFLCLFSFSSTTFASSSAGEVTKQLILSKSQLEKQGKTGKNYIKAIDSFVEENALDSGKLSEIQQKITMVLPKLGNSQKDRVIKEVLNYLDYKIQYVSLKAPTMSSGSSGSSSGGVTQTSSQNQNAEEMKKMILGMSEEELGKYLIKLSEEELYDLLSIIYPYDTTTKIKEIEKDLIDYMSDSKDSITQSNIYALASNIEVQLSMGKLELSHLIGKTLEDYSNLERVWKVGYVDFTLLPDIIYFQGEEKKLLDGYGNELLMAYYKKGSEEYYQILGFLGNNNNQLKAKIKGNYVGISPKSLFQNYEDGKIYSVKDSIRDIKINNSELYMYTIFNFYTENNPKLLEKMNSETQNSEVNSELRQIAVAIEIELTKGNIKIQDIIDSKSLISHKTSIGTIYTGKINFDGLNLNADNFTKDILGAYIIDNSGNSMYQILGYTDFANIKGNYIMMNSQYPNSLFKDSKTGKYIQQGDLKQ